MAKSTMTLINTYASKKILLAIILIVGTSLRLQHLQQPFVDAIAWRQTSTAMMAKNFYSIKMNIFYPQVDWGGPGPNYQGREFQTLTFITALLYKVFGVHDWLGRLIVIVFGVWGIFSFYKLVERVWDQWSALLSAAILAILPGSIFLDRSFLPDPVMVSLLVTSLWLLVSYCQTEKVYQFVLAVLIGFLGVLTKLNGAILGLPALYIIIKFLGKKFISPKKLLLHLGLPAVMLLVVLAYYLWANHLALTGTTKHFAGTGKFLNSFEKLKEWVGLHYFIKRLFSLLQLWMWTLPVLLLSIVGLFISPPKKTGRWFFHFWAIALTIQYSIEAEHLVEDPQNLQMFNFLAAALSANALLFFSVLLKKHLSLLLRRALVLLVFISILIISEIHLKVYYFPYYQPAYNLGKQLATLANKKDLIVSFGYNPVAIYYSGLRGWNFPPPLVWDDKRYQDYGEMDLQMLKILKQSGAKWLLIHEDNEYSEVANKEALQAKYPAISSFIFLNYKVVVQNADGLILKMD